MSLLFGPVPRRGGIEQSFFRAEKFLIEVFLALVCDVPAVAAARVPRECYPAIILLSYIIYLNGFSLIIPCLLCRCHLNENGLTLVFFCLRNLLHHRGRGPQHGPLLPGEGPRHRVRPLLPGQGGLPGDLPQQGSGGRLLPPGQGRRVHHHREEGGVQRPLSHLHPW